MNFRRFLASFWLLLALAHTTFAEPLEDKDSDAPAKRGLCNSRYDEIAMSICGALHTDKPYISMVFPIRRKCPSKENCDYLCKSPEVVKQMPSWTKGSPQCLESLHIYKKRPQLKPDQGSNTVDVNRVGLLTRRYHSCNVSGCGPNYCCCRK